MEAAPHDQHPPARASGRHVRTVADLRSAAASSPAGELPRRAREKGPTYNPRVPPTPRRPTATRRPRLPRKRRRRARRSLGEGPRQGTWLELADRWRPSTWLAPLHDGGAGTTLEEDDARPKVATLPDEPDGSPRRSMPRRARPGPAASSMRRRRSPRSPNGARPGRASSSVTSTRSRHAPSRRPTARCSSSPARAAARPGSSPIASPT